MLEAAVAGLGKLSTFDAVERGFNQSVVPVLHRVLAMPLKAPLSDAVSPTDCCDAEVVAARRFVAAYDDVKLLVMRAAQRLLKEKCVASGSKRGAKRSRDDASSDLVANVYCMLYNVAFAGGSDVGLYFGLLAAEKRQIERSEAYSNANASERRALQLKTVLSVFSERAHRKEFSGLWTTFVSCDVHPCLRLNFLTGVGTAILPHLSNPLGLADYLSTCFSHGGLAAVLSLEGMFVLMVQHGLEFPEFYDQLYSLLTGDAFLSHHRSQLFKLVNLALTSVRVPAYVAAAFIKRIARLLLYAPAPALYFGLPFLRQLFQRHPNCLALIHRTSLTDPDSELFEGKDPYVATATRTADCRAIDSTLWELAILEHHFLPAVRLMVAAFASPAIDNQPLKFEKTYARLFAHDLTHAKEDAPAVVAYKAPPEAILGEGSKSKAFAGVFVA